MLLFTFLGLVSWVGVIVAVYISRFNAMGMHSCACLHIYVLYHG